MPKISNKGRAMPPSPIRKLVPYADTAKKRGIKVHHLNIGQPDIPTPQIAIDAVKNINDTVFEYCHSAGLLSYRQRLTEYYKKVGIDVTAEEILITTGGSEAIFMAMSVCMDEGDEMLVAEPFYANYNGFAVEAGIRIVPVRSTIENDFALPPMEAFEKSITPRTKAIMITNPNNPTGYTYTKEELLALREIVLRHDLFLFADEVYREFSYGEVSMSALNLEGLEQHVVMIDSVSKRYSMCGVRIGALVTRNRDIFDAALKIAQARLSPPYIAQVSAMAAVDTPQSYFDEVYAEYLRRRDCIVSELNAIPGVYCPVPKGAFYVVARLPVDDSDRFAQWMLEEFSYKGQTVMIAPATGFYATQGLGRDEVRVAYVLNCDDLRAAAECLREGLKIYPGRTN